MKPEDKFFEMLMDALYLLAADYLTQEKTLPDFVFLPDEVISIFSEAYLLFPQVIDAGMVNDTQINSLRDMNDFIKEMEEKKEQNIWSVEAMRYHPDWNRLRAFARSALADFGKTPTLPHPDWISYVKSGKIQNK